MTDLPAAIVETAYTQEVGALDGALAQPEAPLPEGLYYLDETVTGIDWDAKYATEDNFTGRVVEGYAANRVVLTRALAKGLVKARDLAAEAGYRLLIWDAVRPQRAVDDFVTWSKAPEDGKTKEAHYPRLKKTDLLGEYVARRSGHSRGRAVDLTLTDAQGHMIDMGGGFDLMDEKSHHGAKGLTKAQTANRKFLKKLMKEAGFEPYSSEWWHYSLKKEPFPDTYFDFEITPAPVAAREDTPAETAQEEETP